MILGQLTPIGRTGHFGRSRFITRLVVVSILKKCDIFRGGVHIDLAGSTVTHNVYRQQSQQKAEDKQGQMNVFGRMEHV